MNDIELKQVKDLAHRLDVKYASRTVQCAGMLRTMAQATGTGEDDKAYDAYARVADRVCGMMLRLDEPRFSMHDYADAVGNARRAVDPEKLLAVPDDVFDAAMVWLATDKRETYEDREHMQEDLEADIWA